MFQFISSLFNSTGTPFNIADKVTAFGNEGFVKSISTNGMFIEVSFPDSPTTIIFTIDGRVHNWNKSPSLRKL